MKEDMERTKKTILLFEQNRFKNHKI